MKKPVIIVIILVVVGILGFVGYSLLTGSKVPQTFIDKHNEKAALEKEASQLSDLNNLPEWSDFNQQMDDKNYPEALTTIKSGLGRKEEAALKLEAIVGKLSELKPMAADIADPEIKSSAENFIMIAEKENAAKIVYNNLQIQMLEKLEAMISILAENPETISVADEETINNLSEEIEGLEIEVENAENELNGIQGQYEAAEKDFFALAGLEAEE